MLGRLHALGKIDDLSFQTAQNAPLSARRHTVDADLQAPFISEMARQILYRQLGEKVYELGLNVTVTINSEYQQKANAALRQGLLDYDVRHGFRGAAGRLDLGALDTADPQAAAAALADWSSSRELQTAVVTQVSAPGFAGVTAQGKRFAVALADMAWARQHLSPNRNGPVPAAATEVVQPGDVVYVREHEDKWELSQLPAVSGALVSLHPGTGAIYALTGGFDYYLSKFNRAAQARRQPGSNIKPFIYSAALEHGFTPASLVSAAPIVVENELEGVWRPQNYSKKFFGPTRLRKALSQSLNLVSVRLLRAMGLDAAIRHLEQFGFEREQLARNLTLSLGSIQVTPLELAARYAVFANGGHRVAPYLIERITDAAGRPFPLPPCAADCDRSLIKPAALGVPPPLTAGPTAAAAETPGDDPGPAEPSGREHRRAISPQNAYLITSMLKQVIRSGTGRRALALERGDLAGKTGTTNNFKDAWFSGYSPEVMTTVFVGFDEPSYLGGRESGATAALPIWIDYMGLVLQDFPAQPDAVPENITTRFINKATALVTAADDPDGYTEYYELGSEPDNLTNNVDQSTTSAVKTETVTEQLF